MEGDSASSNRHQRMLRIKEGRQRGRKLLVPGDVFPLRRDRLGHSLSGRTGAADGENRTELPEVRHRPSDHSVMSTALRRISLPTDPGRGFRENKLSYGF